MTATAKIAVTGAAGRIAYALLFRLASGQLLGPDTKVHIAMLDIPGMEKAMRGVAMELEDCGFHTLAACTQHTDARECFADLDYAFLVGAKPRGPGMERKDLLAGNARIFVDQGQALADTAKPSVKVLVVGNPANTNALVASRNAAGRIDPANFSAMTRLDENRARAQVAAHCGVHVGDVSKVVIWGNHSSTLFPDIAHATVAGQPAAAQVDEAWYRGTMIEAVQKRGAAIIDVLGASSAASAASAALDHMRDWALGTPPDTWASMAVRSAGEYGMEQGVFCSYPCTCAGGKWSIVPDLPIADFARDRMLATNAELCAERDEVDALA